MRMTYHELNAKCITHKLPQKFYIPQEITEACQNLVKRLTVYDESFVDTEVHFSSVYTDCSNDLSAHEFLTT